MVALRTVFRRAGPAFLVLVAAVAPASAPAAAAELRRGAALLVERALGGDTLALAGGQVLRLAGILAPRPQDRGAAPEVEAAAEAARAALDGLARGQTLRLWRDTETADRHGRIVAHAALADGSFLADALLRAGHARVFTQPGAAARAAAMLALEREARAARRGLWALAAYAVHGDAEAGRYTDSFQIVEGKIVKAARARGVYYLNFGSDYRRDFTIGLDGAAQRAFRRAGLDPASLAGKTVRVRGWLIWRGGPYIGATHTQQIEALD